LQALCALLLPIVVIGLRYKLFSKSVGVFYSFTFIGAILFFYLIIRFWSDFGEWAHDLGEGMFREVLMAISKLGPYILLASLGLFAKSLLSDYVFLTMVLFIGNAFGVVFGAYHNYYKRKVLIAGGAVRVLK
jgi:hypothetical protein